MKINFLNKQYIINFFTLLFLLALPYYLFDGKIFIGGDDTRLFYTFPIEFIKNVSFFSWSNEATIGITSPTQFLVPLLTIWSFFSILIPSKLVLTYLAFSIPIITGLLFFQKSVKELFSLKDKNFPELYIGSIFYVLSPILILDQYFIFLTTIWLIGLIPLILYFFTKFLKTSDFKYTLFAAISCIIFSGALYSIPWILGFLLPLFLGLILVSPLFKKKDKINFIKKFITFFGFIALTQSYWLAGFASSYIEKDPNSVAQKFISKDFLDTFTPTVVATATGNIFYPLINLFHRQIAFDFVWLLKNVFENFYDKFFFVGVIFIFTFFFGVFNFKNVLNKLNQKLFLFLLLSFIFSLYFFTVNIGPLKDLFLSFGHIPGFVMFRNFYDKFSVGFIIIYSILITISLTIVRDRIARHNLIFLLFLFAVIINFIPIKQTVNSPLWTTKNTYRVIKIPDEYLNFMSNIKETIAPTNTILNLPFGTSIYSVIKDENSNNVYVGTSPVKIFSGLGDISGHYSFNFTQEANIIYELFLSKDYEKLNTIFYKYNINYVMLTKNIPLEVKNAWVFDKNMLKVQDENFLKAITQEKVITSSAGNYELYKSKTRNSLIKSDNLYFKKISPVKYKIYITNIKNKQDLDFLDSYHAGWKLYINKNTNKNWCEVDFYNKNLKTFECKPGDKLFETEDLAYSFKNDTFDKTHNIRQGFSNYWNIDPSFIQSNFSKDYYKKNSDETIDIELTLYFVRQNYFYYGLLITLISFIFGFIYWRKKHEA